MSPHFLPNFEIQNYYQSEPNFNDFYPRYNVPKTKGYVVDLNFVAFKSIWTH